MTATDMIFKTRAKGQRLSLSYIMFDKNEVKDLRDENLLLNDCRKNQQQKHNRRKKIMERQIVPVDFYESWTEFLCSIRLRKLKIRGKF